MLSKAYTHFPEFRHRNGLKLLWNPILKKTFKNRPEERVRLQLIDYLTLEAGFSSHRISFESPVKLTGEKSLSRTDIICYDGDFKPLLLVECKAPDIKLNEKASLQVARYNQEIGAPYILVSNGMLDFWFEIEGDQIKQLNHIPDIFSPKKKRAIDFTYWKNRGFAGEKTHPDARAFILHSCDELYTNAQQPMKHLGFEGTPPELALSHYYRIFGLEPHLRIACSFSATPYGGTRLNVVLNQKGENTAFLSASLDMIAGGQADNTHLQSAKGTLSLDLREAINFNFETNLAESVSSFKELLAQHS